MKTYKDKIKEAMEFLGRDPKTRFIGYGVGPGTAKASGFLSEIDEQQLVETPVAENLMAGLATGMSLGGLKPVVYFERFDFVLNALDAIVNHLAKLKRVSRGQYNPKVIMRVVVGGTEAPFFTGATHTQDFSEALKLMVDFPIIVLDDPSQIESAYKEAYESTSSVMIVERKDYYEKILTSI
tara:strand:+ start:4937 stop:5482 length:546 start_codon:yes stop_codon:yes gene_type:complete